MALPRVKHDWTKQADASGLVRDVLRMFAHMADSLDFDEFVQVFYGRGTKRADSYLTGKFNQFQDDPLGFWQERSDAARSVVVDLLVRGLGKSAATVRR